MREGRDRGEEEGRGERGRREGGDMGEEEGRGERGRKEREDGEMGWKKRDSKQGVERNGQGEEGRLGYSQDIVLSFQTNFHTLVKPCLAICLFHFDANVPECWHIVFFA